ncbi:iron ABC transporter permease [Demequina sp. SYSU T00068]|uniref:ABC transporter permease n=1 Tax=Demequina lignilytica TaxID=3051663 RepID=UPI002602B3EE|nr:iron ABC transporter permease [Demequina sp. SYSU T00068]MDN4489900.1 iron ABC transporter permease [Demequina sp. SYSU T00068]
MTPAPASARLWWALAGVPLLFLGTFFLWPAATLLWRGLVGDDAGVGPGAGLAEAWAVLASSRTLRAIATTAWLALAGTAGSLVLGLPAAWALSRFSWRGSRTVRALVTVPFVLPTIVVAAAFSALFAASGILGGLGLDQSPVAIVLALVFFNVSVVVRIVGGAWEALPPGRSLAARTLGASRWRAFVHTTLPALRPAIASSAAVVFLFCSTSFALVLTLGGTRVRTIETEIWIQVNQFLDLRAAAVLALVQVAFVGLALWVSSRASHARAAAGVATARRRGPRGRERWAVAAALLPTLALLALPIAALVERSLRVVGGYGLDHYRALLVPPARTALPVPVWEAAVNSLVTALIATAMATVVGLVTAQLLAARSRRAGVLESLVMLPLGVSAVVVGLGLLLTLNRAVLGVDLRGSWWLVPIAQAVVALPLMVRALVPAARAIDPRLRAAAATLGASPWRTWWQVDARLLRAPAGASIAFAFAISMGEFGATVFVARPDRPTLTTAISRLLSRPGLDNAGMAFAAAVLLAALTAAVMLLSERLRTTVGAEL